MSQQQSQSHPPIPFACAVLILVLAVLDGCAPSSVGVSQYSLYYRTGQHKMIEKITDKFVDQLLADSELNFERVGSERSWKPTQERVNRLKSRLTDYLCVATGGPEIYDGDNLRRLHRGMAISLSEFDRFIADFDAVLQETNVPDAQRQEWKRVFLQVSGQIIEPTATQPAKDMPTDTPNSVE